MTNFGTLARGVPFLSRLLNSVAFGRRLHVFQMLILCGYLNPDLPEIEWRVRLDFIRQWQSEGNSTEVGPGTVVLCNAQIVLEKQ
jgi:hypothetical protein